MLNDQVQKRKYFATKILLYGYLGFVISGMNNTHLRRILNNKATVSVDKKNSVVVAVVVCYKTMQLFWL